MVLHDQVEDEGGPHLFPYGFFVQIVACTSHVRTPPQFTFVKGRQRQGRMPNDVCRRFLPAGKGGFVPLAEISKDQPLLIGFEKSLAITFGHSLLGIEKCRSRIQGVGE